MKYEVYCVGEMVIDFTPTAEKATYCAHPGGAPANVAIAMARLGRRTAFTGKVGNDEFGRELLAALQENHVPMVGSTPCDEATTTLVFVHLQPDGERTFTFARKPGADMFLTPQEIDLDVLAGAEIVHAGSCSLSAGSANAATKYALRTAHTLGKHVSFDINYRPPLWNGNKEKVLREVASVLPYVDFLKLSDEELDFVGGCDQIPLCMEQYGISLLVVTLGAQGADAYLRGRKTPIHIDGMKAVVADTNGAGDAFWSGMLSALLTRGDWKLTPDGVMEMLRFANVCGWLTVQTYGAIPAFPRMETVRNYLE